MSIYGYVYITTNLINNKKYIGQHKGNELDKNYFGSGALIQKAIKKYGKSNFKCELLDIAHSQSELNEKEIYWIKHFDAVDSDDYYNLVIDSQGSHTVSEQLKKHLSEINTNKKLSDETKRKLSKIHKGKKCGNENPAKRPDVRAKLKIVNHGKNNPAYGKHWFTNGIETVYAYECPDGFIPGRSKSHRDLQSSKIKGRHWYNNGTINIQTYECPEGFVEGRLKYV